VIFVIIQTLLLLLLVIFFPLKNVCICIKINPLKYIDVYRIIDKRDKIYIYKYIKMIIQLIFLISFVFKQSNINFIILF